MPNMCEDCGREIDPRARRCHPCAGKVVRARSDTPEYRHKISRGVKAAHARGAYDDVYNNLETQRKKSESQKAAWARGAFGPRYLCRISKATKASHARGVYNGHSEAIKAAWERGAYESRIANQPPYKSTEVPLAAALDICGIEHISQYRPDGHGRIYDEFVLPNILIEAHGDYWHGPEYPENQKRDAEKVAWAEENGYCLVIIWESEIKRQGAWALVHERILPLLG